MAAMLLLRKQSLIYTTAVLPLKLEFSTVFFRGIEEN